MCKSWLLVFSLLFFSFIHASDDPRVEYLGIEKGLSNNTVTSIFQDHDGFMWIGTYDGLNKYDGYSFRVFRNIIGDNRSLRDNHIYTMDGDASHNIWIGGLKGISIYNPERSEFSAPKYREWDEREVKAIHEVVFVIRSFRTTVLAGTSKGLLVFENNSQTGIHIPLPALAENKANYTVSAIDIDSASQSAWIFVDQVGLCKYDLKIRSLQVISTSVKQAICLKTDRKGTLLLGNDNGLYRFDNNTGTFSENLMSSKKKVTRILEDKQGVLWGATDGSGLWLFPKQTGQAGPYVSSSGVSFLNSSAIADIFEDKDGRKWIGTLRGGINIIDPKTSPFRLITHSVPGQNNINNNFINTFCEDEKSNVWIGTSGAGLRYWNREKNTFSRYINNSSDKKSISSNFITYITTDFNNDVWIATYFGGVNRLNKTTQSFDRFTCLNPRTNVEENNVWVIYEDRQQRLWASTVNNGTLYTFNRSSNQFDLFDNSIVNVQSLAEDKKGQLWAGTYTSLIAVDVAAKKHRVFNIGFPVRSIHEDKNGNFWIGTEGGGLLLFDRTNGSYTRYTTAEGLPNNSILRILEDSKGFLWFSTYNGLCKFEINTKSCRNFLQSDGLQSNQFSFNAGLQLRNGEFLFGGIRGFNIFYPDSVYAKQARLPVFLTGIKVNNVSNEQDDSYITRGENDKPDLVTVSYDQAVLSLDYLALEYTGADKIKYAYLLEGWDKNWNYVNNIRTANYSRLWEGVYTFKVKATNTDGQWGEEIVLLKIKVLPPWYRTWWAYMLYVLILVGAIYLYITYNKKQERLRYEIKLAHLAKEQEKELTEKRIAFFTHISHEFRTPLTLIINPLKELFKTKEGDESHKKISMVYRNARRLLSLVDQLLLFRRVESVDQQMRVERFDIVEVCQEVYLSFSQHAIAKNINFSFDRNEHPISMYGDKEKIEIILFNLVSNAFKYTESGGSVDLRIIETTDKIEISVKDTGSGIAAGIGNKLFESFYRADSKDSASQTGFGVGLYVSYKLAEAHHGKLSYTSDPGQGTQFILDLLKGKEHFTNYLIRDFKGGQTILHELVEEPLTEELSAPETITAPAKTKVIDKLRSDLPTMVIVDDNEDIRSYIKEIFSGSFNIYEADDGGNGYDLVKKEIPDIVISDVMMRRIGGLELCQKIKEDQAIAHIPVILLTASSSDELKLKGFAGGADDYITKPFDKEIIIARIGNILKGRNRLQQYFFNAVTLRPTTGIAGEHKKFIEDCIAIVDKHLHNPDFNIKIFCKEIGMSHPSLYKKVKAVSGLTVNVFVRYLRLRKAAELLINTDKTIVEVTYITGFNDVKYFREQFNKLFEMNPSEYVKRYRRVLGTKPAE